VTRRRSRLNLAGVVAGLVAVSAAVLLLGPLHLVVTHGVSMNPVYHQGDLVMPSGRFNSVVQKSVVSSMTAGLHLASRVVVHSADYGRHSAFLAQSSH